MQPILQGVHGTVSSSYHQRHHHPDHQQHQQPAIMEPVQNDTIDNTVGDNVINPVKAAVPPRAVNGGGASSSNSGKEKTPVSLLQEALSRRGITPSYELVQIEGAIHEPTFRYRVSFNDKDAMGAGKSKKEAKHAAARALIELLTDTPFDTSTATVVAPPADQDSDAADSNGNGTTRSNNADDQISGNPIGWLQEQCMFLRWPPPTYETEMEVGLPHMRQFTIGCCVLKLREVGIGKSKKIAKRLAAHKMWSRLIDMNAADAAAAIGDELNNANGGSSDDPHRLIEAQFGDLKEAHIPVLTNQNSFKVSQFHRAMKASNGPRLGMLQQTCLSVQHLNYVQFLHEIAVEHQFEVTYVDIDEYTLTGQQQCFVQLSTMPVAVLAGQGNTHHEAQLLAAHNALQYLKIMTKT